MSGHCYCSWLQPHPNRRPGLFTLLQFFDDGLHHGGHDIAATHSGQVTLYECITVSLQAGPDVLAKYSTGSSCVISIQNADFFAVCAQLADFISGERAKHPDLHQADFLSLPFQLLTCFLLFFWFSR